MPPLLSVKGLCKSFNVPVLNQFDLEMNAGEVHALMGSNGAGKSTFANILCGLLPFEQGQLQIDGQSYRPKSKQEASSTGVVMVHQELNIIPTLSIAENLLFHQLPNRFGCISKTDLRQQAKQALARVQLEGLDPDAPASSLGVGQQQLIEIAAALTQTCRLLILDEPTAALTDPEIETLFAQIRKLTQQGVAVLYISHRMDEIRRICDTVSVMRDGKRISTRPTESADQQTIVNEMAGKGVLTPSSSFSHTPTDTVVLEARHIAAPPKVRDLSFTLRRGEILGLAGLVSSGRTECLRALFGVDPIVSGEILVNGKPLKPRHPADAVKAGIGMVPENRKSDGLLLSQSIRANASLATMDLYSNFGFTLNQKEEVAAQQGAEQLEIKNDHVEQEVSQLSGGNQQKVVILRWLLRESSILLLDEPTRGVDAHAKESIYKLLRQLAGEGKAILVVSSELLELMTLCHRIAAFSGGAISEEFTPDTWSQEKITHAAFSAYLQKQG